MRALVARAATLVEPDAKLAKEAPELISAMLAAGYDQAAARWIPAMGRMDVEDAARRKIQDRRGHDLAVVGQHAEDRPQGRHRLDRSRVTDPIRLDEREAELAGASGDGNRGDDRASTDRPIRRADDPDNVGRRRRDERLEDRHGEGSRPEKDRPARLGAVDPARSRLGRDVPRRGGHARAFAASSASSSSPWPTGMSSSIESR